MSSALAILAAADAGLTLYERTMDLLEQARKEGLITAEQQQMRINRVKDYANRAGVPLIDLPGEKSDDTTPPSDDPSLPPPQTGP